MIILTQEQAQEVRGVSSEGAGLDPRQLLGGEFALPEAVLSDPAHAEKHEYLSTLPTREVTEEEWPPQPDA